MRTSLYSPRVYDDHIRPLYRLARVRGVPMTRLLNGAVAALLASAGDEIAQYRPVVHDRRPRCHNCGRSAQDRLAA